MVRLGHTGETSSVPGVGGVVMDVVNGKIVDKVILVAGMEAIKSRDGATTNTVTSGGMKASQGLGLKASARADTGPRPQQASAVGLGQWAPTWAASGMPIGNSSSPTAVVPASLDSAARRRDPWAPERGGCGANDFRGMQDQYQQVWKRSADQERSKIAKFARDHVTQALGLKPSCARVAAAEWALTRASSLESSFEHNVGSRLAVEAAARSGAYRGLLQQPDHLMGLIWNTNSPKRSNSGLPSQRCGCMDHQCPYHFDASPCSEGKLDEEMTQFESQLTRTVSGHFPNWKSVTSSCCPEISESSAPAVTVDAGDDAVSLAEKEVKELVTATTSSLATVPIASLKRKRSGLSDGEVQGELGWTQPLKVLVRKRLTVSDVGELGRIILPKRDAESRPFLQIDTKEGMVLEMKDYYASKRWNFRFKYWVNNKSRMYVLENTGDFIKFHCLKEHDMFVIYEDGCEKLIACGLKKKNGESTVPPLERSKSSVSEAPPTPTEEDGSSHCHDQHR